MMCVCLEVKLTLTNAPPCPHIPPSGPIESISLNIRRSFHHNINIRSSSSSALYQLMSSRTALRLARAKQRVQHLTLHRKMSSNYRQRSVVSSFICTSPQSPEGLKFALLKRSQDVSTYRYLPPPASPFKLLNPSRFSSPSPLENPADHHVKVANGPSAPAPSTPATSVPNQPQSARS